MRKAMSKRTRATTEEIEQAREDYCTDTDDIHVDPDARVTVTSDGSGVWVEAWVWLPHMEES